MAQGDGVSGSLLVQNGKQCNVNELKGDDMMTSIERITKMEAILEQATVSNYKD